MEIKFAKAMACIVFSMCVGPAIGADGPKFEVASVKRTDRCGGGGSIDPGSVALRGVFLKAVVMEAFKVKMEQIQGPSWLETECFDISAKMPEGATRDQVPAMLVSLLTERFKLVAHKEDRLLDGYALVVDKGGVKFKEDDPNKNFMGREKGMMVYSSGRAPTGRLKGVMSMSTLAANLSTKGFGPVQDFTGLTGKYDIDLSWANADIESSSQQETTLRSDADLFTALREALGLKLERRNNFHVEALIIDHIERSPSEN